MKRLSALQLCFASAFSFEQAVTNVGRSAERPVRISVQTPALRTVGNIVTGDDLQTDAVLACLSDPQMLNCQGC